MPSSPSTATSPSTTPRLNLPLLAAAQAQKHVTHNEALMTLDALTQLNACALTASPPAAPAQGEIALVAPAASGAFAGHDGDVAQFLDGGWTFLAPRPGWLATTADDGKLRKWTGSTWADMFEGTLRDPLDRLGVNATADAVNRLAVSARSMLLTHDPSSGSGGVRCVLNKAASADVASVLFQTGWSGRAEIGLMDADALRLRTSPDGATWTTRLSVDPASGYVGVGRAAPAAPLDVTSAIGAGLRLSANVTSVNLAAFDGAANACLCDFDLTSGAADASASLRFFRNTNTSGATTLVVLRGNGSSAINSVLGGNVNSYLNIVGNLGVGVATPDNKLTVAGVAAPASDNAYSLGSAARRWSAVYAATGVINASDRRLKTDIVDCPLGLDFVRALSPKLYRWRQGATLPAPTPEIRCDAPAEPVQPDAARPGRRAHLGLIAQDVKTALEGFDLDCGLWTLADAADPDSVQSLRYDQMVAPLVQAIKELAARLERLEAASA